MTDQPTVQITDPPTPDLDALQQRELPLPVVPVRLEGSVRTHLLPALKSAVEKFPMDTTPRKVMDQDPRRSRTVLVSSVAWEYSRTATGQKAPIPANVVITLTHADSIYASVPTSTGVLTVITELYGE